MITELNALSIKFGNNYYNYKLSEHSLPIFIFHADEFEAALVNENIYFDNVTQTRGLFSEQNVEI